MGKQRILAMDVIRAIATISVVLIHVSALMIGESQFNTNIYMKSLMINQLSRFSVPAFIALSGMGLIATYKENTGYFKFLGRRLYKVIPRYLVWCFIYIFLVTKGKDLYSLGNDIIYGNVFYHLYFVPLIVQFYLVFPFIYKFIGTKRGLIVSFIITMSILVGLHNYILPTGVVAFLERKNMLDWIFYFSLGAFIGNNIHNISLKLQKMRVLISILFILGTGSFIYEIILNTRAERNIDYTSTFLRPSVLIYTVVLILFIFSIKWKNNIIMKVTQYISKNSYGIYLSHALVLYYFTKYYTDHGFSLGTLGFGVKGFFISFFGAAIINEVRKLP